MWSVPGLTIGLLELPTEQPVGVSYAPAVTDDDRYYLWLAGEAYVADELSLSDVKTSRTYGFRQRVLNAVLANGDRAIRSLDGEYHIVLWDSRERCLSIYNDRFGGLPLYWGASPRGFAFAGGVRGVLMAPAISPSPDKCAIREAVTFGGFRLGGRTNVESVKMVSGGTVVDVDGKNSPIFRRYWHWKDVPATPAARTQDVIDEMQSLWKRAIRRRLSDAFRPGQTLSGGLDSRAILAEAAPQARQWTAITYGLTGCDDARYAQRAAAVVNADWMFHPLYGGNCPNWLEKRTAFIQETDGLIDLTDLMHLETLPQQAGLLDMHMSGYIGDAVSGPTFNDVNTLSAAIGQMPRYCASVSMCGSEIRRIEDMLLQELNGASARFAIFEHKLPQSTNRWSAAWRPWFRVRKPFIDYAFFDFCQGLPRHVRGDLRIHERWLRAVYPGLFARIPNQATGVPVLSSKLRWKAAQARRLSWRKVQPVFQMAGIRAPVRVRNYQADGLYWSRPEIRSAIEDVLLRSKSLVCDVFGRDKVRNVLSEYFDRRQAPTQVIGAMYVYESYHEGLTQHLARATG